MSCIFFPPHFKSYWKQNIYMYKGYKSFPCDSVYAVYSQHMSWKAALVFCIIWPLWSRMPSLWLIYVGFGGRGNRYHLWCLWLGCPRGWWLSYGVYRWGGEVEQDVIHPDEACTSPLCCSLAFIYLRSRQTRLVFLKKMNGRVYVGVSERLHGKCLSDRPTTWQRRGGGTMVC